MVVDFLLGCWNHLVSSSFFFLYMYDYVLTRLQGSAGLKVQFPLPVSCTA